MNGLQSSVGVDVKNSKMPSVGSNRYLRLATAAWLALVVVGCSKEPTPAPAPSQPAPSAEAPPTTTAPAEKPPEAVPAAPSAKLAAGSQCAGICARTSELGCNKAGECERVCNETLPGAPCSNEMSAATSCMLARPIKDWECTPDGLAVAKQGVCATEQEAVTACVSKMLGNP